MQLPKQNQRLRDLTSMRTGRRPVRAVPELLEIVAEE